MLPAAAVLTVVGLTPAAHADGDDYPYRGLGQCPLVPLPPTPPTAPHQPGTTPGTQAGTAGGPHGQPTTGPTKPGQPTTGATKPGQPTKPGTQPGTKPGNGTTPPVKQPPKPPRVCARHVWFINGSYGDPWGFALRNCTSFVAWRMRETNGVSDFSGYYGGASWGDADHWDDAARSLGYLVDHVPAVGAIAQTDDGRVGHVAWVSAVGDDGTVTVEEYNYDVAGGYDVRTVPASDFRYLHVADLSPAPYLGSRRGAATTVDARGHGWSARTTAQGDLTVRRPSGRVVRLGAAGTWSSYASPSMLTDARGRVWVAAVTSAGGLFVAHTSTSSSHFGALHGFAQTGWSTTSSPTLVADGERRVRLLGVTAAGDLWVRRTVTPASDRWGRPSRLGLAGSWSPQSAPAAHTDRLGRVWVVAVTRGGSLQAEHTHAHGARWTRFHGVDHRSWSVTSSPSLALAADGRLWLTSVTSHGTLVTRFTYGQSGVWRRATELHGAWSPYSSPALAAEPSGKLWLAAVNQWGRLVVRSTTDSTHWQRLPESTDASVTESPVVATPATGGIHVGTATSTGRLVWQRAGVVHRHPRPHLGRFAVRVSLRQQP